MSERPLVSIGWPAVFEVVDPAGKLVARVTLDSALLGVLLLIPVTDQTTVHRGIGSRQVIALLRY